MEEKNPIQVISSQEKSLLSRKSNIICVTCTKEGIPSIEVFKYGQDNQPKKIITTFIQHMILPTIITIMVKNSRKF